MDGENPLPEWLRQVLIGVGLFLAGGVLAFGYSYRPLHGALNWEIDQLQERLDERNREILALGDELARQKTDESSRIDPDTLAQVEKELEQTKRVLRQAEKDLDRAEKKHRDSLASATKWRKRYEELRDEPPQITDRPAPSRSGPSSGFESSPAAKAPGTEASPGTAERGILPPDDLMGPELPTAH